MTAAPTSVPENVAPLQLELPAAGASSRQVEINAVYPSHKSLSPALRAFLDLAAERLRLRLTDTE
jgi:DNA-binding transcriptional LysR family regulator